MSLRPPGTLRTLSLMFRLGLTWLLNLVLVPFIRRGTPDGPRRASAPRPSGWRLVGVLAMAFIALSMVLMGAQIVGRLSQEVSVNLPGPIAVQTSTLLRLRLYDERFASAGRPGAASRAGGATPNEQPVADALWEEAWRQTTSEAEAAERQRHMLEHYRRHGAAGFRDQRMAVLPGPDLWPPPAARMRLLKALAVFMAVITITLLAYSLGQSNRQLGQGRWDLEWLFSMPVPAGRLFLARICQYGLLNMLGWIVAMPVLLAALLSAGWGYWAVPLAVAGTLHITFLVAAGRVLAETYAQARLSRARAGSLQAVLTIIGSVLLFVLILMAYNEQVARLLVRVSDPLPDAVVCLPGALAAALCGSNLPWLIVLGMAVASWAAAYLSLHGCATLVREGLTLQSGAPSVRGSAAAGGGVAARPWREIGGVLGKELLLLRRDRNLLAATVVLPLLGGMFQFFIYPTLTQEVRQDGRHAAAAAFGIGAYVLLISSMQTLAREQALWILYTFPRRLYRMLLAKAALWTGLAALFALALLAWFLLPGGLTPRKVAMGLFALGGLAGFSFINFGLVILNWRPEHVHRGSTVKSQAAYGSMLLGGMFTSSMYLGLPWIQAVMLMLYVMIAAAIWQLVRDRLPYLLDPSAKPPPVITLADGMAAVFAFLTLTYLASFCLQALIDRPAVNLSVSFVLAGLVVTGVSLLVLWRRRVPDLLARLGLRPGARGWWRALAWGLAGGMSAGAAGMLYLVLAQHVPFVRELVQHAPRLEVSDWRDQWWLVGLVVLAAPVFEEFIFRGLVLRGLEGIVRPVLAVVATATLFAVIHPPASMAPVFVLGLTAGLVFRHTGLLIAPMLTHAVYNCIVMVSQARG